MTEENTPQDQAIENRFKEERNIASDNTPYNELDMQYKTTNPAWGREATQYLDEKLTKVNSDNKTEKSWELLAYYTRDLRLANLDFIDILECKRFLSIAGDCLRMNHNKSFVTALSRVIDTVELSQSKGGFLRRRTNTFTKESVQKDENASRNLLGGKRVEQ